MFTFIGALLLAGSAAAGNPLAGRDKADSERCLECHGASAQGQGFSNGSDGKIARLDGQQAAYLVKQVRDFRSGARRHEFMAMMANSVSDADLADIAAYFAAEPAAAAAGDGLGAQLYRQACAACHGAQGQGVAGAGPMLAGQGRRYLAQQLANWRSGERANSAGGVMNQAAKGLSDADIEALARYLAGTYE